MIDCLGIVNFEDDRSVVEGLSDFRTIPAISFLGRYRIIDFVLSNMVNSGMDQIKVLVKHKPRSLIEHLGNGSQYNINSKHGSMQILYTDHQIVNKMYFTDIALLKQYRTYIEECPYEYVVVAPSYMVCRIDYQEVLKSHIESKADITCVYKEVHNGSTSFLNCQEYEFDDNGKIWNMKVSHGSIDEKFISLETYAMSKEMLIKIIDEASSLSSLYTLSDFIKYKLGEITINPYSYDGYLRCINSQKEYFDTSIELIEHEKAKELFDRNWPVFTRTNDSAPAFYSSHAKVKNCLIANGCVVEGKLENCILGRGVKIRKGAVVKNSVLLPGAVIEEDANIEYAIIDKSAIVRNVKTLIGTEDNLMYVARRDIV